MTARDALLLLLLFLPLLTLHPASGGPSPSPSPEFDISKTARDIRDIARDKSGQLWNKTKTFLGISPATTTTPLPTTKAPVRIIFIPKVWPKKKWNDTTVRTLTTELPETSTGKKSLFAKVSNGIREKSKKFWNKTKQVLGYSQLTTTPRPPSNVWLVPLRWELKGNAEPLVAEDERPRTRCSSGKHESFGQLAPCTTSSPQVVAGFSWWMVILPLGGMTAAGVGAWILLARARETGIPRYFPWEKKPCDAVKVHPSTLSRPRARLDSPPPLAPVHTRSAVGPAPKGHPPPVPEPRTLHANSLYQPSVVASLHVYATPVVRPGTATAAWSSSASEHVHIYETPPCFPT